MELIDAYNLIEGQPLSAAVSELEGKLRESLTSPFARVIGHSFANDIPKITDYFLQISRSGPYAAIYIEMNGFTINANRWYADGFGYADFGGGDDWDWLCDWQSPNFPPLGLTAMEQVRQVFQRYYSPGPHASDPAKYFAEVLVVCRFNQAVESAGREARRSDSNLQASRIISTAHDYDFFHVS